VLGVSTFPVPCQQLCDRWSAASDGDLSQFSANDIQSLTSDQTKMFVYKVFLLEVIKTKNNTPKYNRKIVEPNIGFLF
jgi:hypothetical protein